LEAIEAIKKNTNQSEKYKKSGEATRRHFGKEPDHEKSEIINEAGLNDDISLHEGQRLQAAYKAALLKIELQEKEGTLLPADEVLSTWTDHIKRAKVRILSIKSKVAPLIMDFLTDLEQRESVLQIIDSTCREALEELSNDR